MLCITQSCSKKNGVGMETQFASLIFGATVLTAAGLMSAFNSRIGYDPSGSLSSLTKGHKSFEYVEGLAAVGTLKSSAIGGVTRSLTSPPHPKW